MKTEEFKQIRLEAGMNQTQLGAYLEVTLGTVHRLETGKTKIRRPVKIAMRALKEKADEIGKIKDGFLCD